MMDTSKWMDSICLSNNIYKQFVLKISEYSDMQTSSGVQKNA